MEERKIKVYERKTLDIPKDEGKGFLEIVRILGEENYSGPFNGGENFYDFKSCIEKDNKITVNPVTGKMTFSYLLSESSITGKVTFSCSLFEKERSEKRFLSIKKTIEDKFGVIGEVITKGKNTGETSYKINPRTGRWDLSE